MFFEKSSYFSHLAEFFFWFGQENGTLIYVMVFWCFKISKYVHTFHPYGKIWNSGYNRKFMVRTDYGELVFCIIFNLILRLII